MGGKGSQTTAPPPQSSGSGGNDDMMMALMMSMMENQSTPQYPAPPEASPAPLVSQVDPIDWSSQMDDLKSKAKADYATQSRKTRLDTIHASLTDDNQDTEMNSLLSETL